MKPTPPDRLHWPVVGLILTASVLLLWGCGHTREVLYPDRKLSPPRPDKSRATRPRLQPTDPIALDRPAETPPQRPSEAPTVIDVPIIDRNGRSFDPPRWSPSG